MNTQTNHTPGEDKAPGNAAVQFLKPLLVFAGAGTVMGLALLTLAFGSYPAAIFADYLLSPRILLYNLLPVIFLMIFFYGLTGRGGFSAFAGGGVFLALSIGNYFKLCFRDEPVFFSDMVLIREAGAMTSHYALFVSLPILIGVLTLIIVTLAASRLLKQPLRKTSARILTAAGAAICSAVLVFSALNPDSYRNTRNYRHLDPASTTQNYIAHGFVYPFLHSVEKFIELPPEHYSPEAAEALMASEPEGIIPADRRIHIISLMREAYMDFSRFEIAGLDTSDYEIYHQLEKESLTGNLVTNIFAGGTVDSERCFLSGSYRLKNFTEDTNSYVRYLKSQGYYTEGLHPFHNWFYHRDSINRYLGFDSYRYLEGDFENIVRPVPPEKGHTYPEDKYFYPEVFRDFDEHASAEHPYFSFALNVESHGPYSTEPSAGKSYLTGDYTDACKNAMNHYMATTMEGDRELSALIEKLRHHPEPVIFVTFGDHLPWMGDGNAFYHEMGVDIDPSSDEGFLRHYSTRYLIWANEAAQEIIGHPVKGQGPDISPCYLMNLIFEQCGYEGPSFMQAMEKFRSHFPVVTTNDFYQADGTWVREIPEKLVPEYEQFLNLQYYWRNQYRY